MKISLSGIKLVVYEAFLQHKFLSDLDLLKITNLNPNSIRPTRLALEQMGLIKRTHRRKNHKTSNKRKTLYTVYELTRVISTRKFDKKTQKKKDDTSVSSALIKIRKEIDDLLNKIKLKT